MKKSSFLLAMVSVAITALRPADAGAQQAPAVHFYAGPPSASRTLMVGHRPYTVANTHSHNDYEQATPFWLAYGQQFGSIEADIFWVEGKMLVGHSYEEIKN